MCSFYDKLNLVPYASLQEVKKSFRQLAMVYHPDKPTGNKEKFQEINEAYTILSNKQTKDEYDNLLKKYNKVDNYKNKDYSYTMNITIGESITGIDKIFYYTIDGDSLGIQIKLPSGIPDGKKIKFIGSGEHKNPNARKGDLIITLKIIDSNNIKISNNGDVTIKLPIDYILACIGGEKYIDGFYEGHILKFNIPESVKNGEVLYLENEGIFNQRGIRGRVYGIVNLYPPKLSSKKIEALRYISEYVDPEMMVWELCKVRD